MFSLKRTYIFNHVAMQRLAVDIKEQKKGSVHQPVSMFLGSLAAFQI